MPSGGARPGAGRPPKVHPDGSVKPRKRKKLAPGEAPRPRGRPRKTSEPPVTALPPQVEPIQTPLGTYLPNVAVDAMPLDMALLIMRDPNVHPETRIRCMQMALPFTTPKPGADKKTLREQEADELAELKKSSRFSAGRPPLRAVGEQ